MSNLTTESRPPNNRSQGVRQIEGINRSFYNRFPFPPPPMRFEYMEDPLFELRMLGQTLGDWNLAHLPSRPSIWVAGCGRFQAVATALSFPTANVLGSDIADESLNDCARTAEELGLTNLTLRRQSLHETASSQKFDLIVCIGVVHCLADPELGLRDLARALKPNGVLELMVYNRFHRIECSASRQAIEILTRKRSDQGADADLKMAHQVIGEFPLENRLGKLVQGSPTEAMFADTFLQPVEYSYTVASLASLAEKAGLQMLQPRIAKWDQSWDTSSWNVELRAPELRERFERLSDLERWQVSNLLLRSRSPLVWFYFQRQDSPRPRKTERQLCDEFLQQTFEPTSGTQRHFRREKDGRYTSSPGRFPYPRPPRDAASRKILEAIDGKTAIAEVLASQGFKTDFLAVNELRTRLTTRAFPYLAHVAARCDTKVEGRGRIDRDFVKKTLKAAVRRRRARVPSLVESV